MALIVEKFGGSSLANTEKLRNAAGIAASDYRKENQVVVVVSAQGDATDHLIAQAEAIGRRVSPREMDVLLSTGEQASMALMAMMRGVSLDRCAAVGDSPNDLSMLKVVGTPIAMGNAGAEVKSAACHVAADNGHDGVAEAIRWCLEQRT